MVILCLVWIRTAVAQCYEEPVRGTMVKASNKLRTVDAVCFDNLRVDMTKCFVRVTSSRTNCSWVSLTGSIGGISADSVLLAGPLTQSSSLRWFEMKVANGYAAIKLELLENRNRSIIYRVDQGRVFQLRAALPSNSNVTFGTSDVASSTALANCNTGSAGMRMVGVSRTCAWLGTYSCLRNLLVQVSGCNVWIYSSTASCPVFQGSIQGNGGSATVFVQINTLSRANPISSLAASASTPPDPAPDPPPNSPAAASATPDTAADPPPKDPTGGIINRRLLQRTGRTLQQVTIAQGDQWTVLSSGTMVRFTRLGCDLYYSMTFGKFLLNSA